MPTNKPVRKSETPPQSLTNSLDRSGVHLSGPSSVIICLLLVYLVWKISH